MRALSILFVALMVVFLPVASDAAVVCTDITFSVDVPTAFGASFASTLQAYQAIRCSSDVYAAGTPFFSGSGLSGKTNIVSLAARKEGGLLITADAPFTVTPTYCSVLPCTFSNRDIVKTTYDGVNWQYELYVLGSDISLPAATVIDSLAIDKDGKLLVSFDAPTTLFGTTYQPQDIVKITSTTAPGAYAMFVSGSGIGIPAGTNVVGFDLVDKDYYYMFDVPTTNGAVGLNGARSGWGWRKPGAGGLWDTVPFYKDDDYAEGNIGTDFTLPASPGTIATNSLLVTKSGADLAVAWTVSCSTTATSYEVYEGNLGTWTSHIAATLALGGSACTSPASPETITPGASNKYYLVVPRSSLFEGGYGYATSGTARSQSSVPCVATQKSMTCP